MKTLDTQKPHGSVHGMGRVKFEQAGVYFDTEGNEVVEVEAAAEEARVGEESAKLDAPVPVEASLDPSDAPVTPEAVAKALDQFEPVPEPAQVEAQLAVGIDLDGDGVVDVKVKGGKVTKAKKGKKK